MPRPVYPVTDRLRKDLAAHLGNPIVQQMVDIVGEYEHGTAEVSDVAPRLTLRQYAAVVKDIVLTLVHSTP